jgi:hypothetical protein
MIGGLFELRGVIGRDIRITHGARPPLLGVRAMLVLEMPDGELGAQHGARALAKKSIRLPQEADLVAKPHLGLA